MANSSLYLALAALCISYIAFSAHAQQEHSVNDLLRSLTDSDTSKVTDIRKWLRDKATEKSNGEFELHQDLAVTPIGNISLQCYNDIMQYASDVQALKLYALRSKYFYQRSIIFCCKVINHIK